MLDNAHTVIIQYK